MLQLLLLLRGGNHGDVRSKERRRLRLRRVLLLLLVVVRTTAPVWHRLLRPQSMSGSKRVSRHNFLQNHREKQNANKRVVSLLRLYWLCCTSRKIVTELLARTLFHFFCFLEKHARDAHASLPFRPGAWRPTKPFMVRYITYFPCVDVHVRVSHRLFLFLLRTYLRCTRSPRVPSFVPTFSPSPGILVVKLTPKFRDATRVVELPLSALRPSAQQVLVRVHYAAVNASDVNFTAGVYLPGIKPPLPCGMEGLGEIVAVGGASADGANAQKRKGASAGSESSASGGDGGGGAGGLAPETDLRVGGFVVFMQYGAFSEYVLVDKRTCFSVPAPDPRFIPLLVSGLTASLSLERVGRLRKGETVLVTAAAGGTGVFAVQLAKLAGCRVVGTCSSADKAALLRALGCDRVVNYRHESLDAVLKKEFPKVGYWANPIANVAVAVAVAGNWRGLELSLFCG